MTKPRPFLSTRFKAMTFAVLGTIAIGLVVTLIFLGGATWLLQWALVKSPLNAVVTSVNGAPLLGLLLGIGAIGLAILLLDLNWMFFRFAWRVIKDIWQET